MNPQKIIIQENHIRGAIRRILLEEEILLVDDYLLGKKFSFSDGAEPAFLVVAENISEGITLIRRYSTMPLQSFMQGLMSLSGPGTSGKPYSPSKDLLEKISKDEEGWKVWEDFKQNFDSLKSQPGEFFLIKKLSSNFKKPIKVSTESGQEKFEKFECVLSIPEIVVNIFSFPTSKEFMQSAACCYAYANSWKALALAGSLGAAVGAYLGASGAGAVGGAATAPAGGVGAIPAALAGAVSGGLEGLALGAASSDVILRLPPFIWAMSNGKYLFGAANAIIIALDCVTLEGSKVSAEAAKKSPILLRAVKGFAQIVLELASPMLADCAIQVDKDRFTQALQDIIDGKYDIKSLLDQSEKDLKAAIKTQYPRL